MTRPSRAAAVKARSKITLQDSKSSSLSGLSDNTQTPESQSIETQQIATAQSSIVAAVTKVKTTVKTTAKYKSNKKRPADEDRGLERPLQKKARSTTKKATSSMLEIVPRTMGMKMLVGAHVSMAKGVQNAITNSHKIGGNAFALFLKSQRKWTSPDIKESDAVAFRDGCKKAGIDPKRHILPHGSYLINLAQKDEEKAKKSYDCFLDDLKRCESLLIGLYNFHPGSTLGLPRSEALARVAAHLNRAHKETKFVKTVLENMAGQGNIIGANFEDLRDIIEQVEDNNRVGVCLDTCHLFAAGHDIRTQASYDTVMANFDRIVGQKYIVALHLNDSKAPLGANRDLHQNIGLGYLGLEPFRIIMNDKRLEGLPMVLETPMQCEKVWADEIKLLESLVGIPVDDPKFLAKAAELSEKGESERKKTAAVVEKRRAMTAKRRQKKADKEEIEEGGIEDGESHTCEH